MSNTSELEALVEALRNLVRAQEGYMVMQRLGVPKESVLNKLSKAKETVKKLEVARGLESVV